MGRGLIFAREVKVDIGGLVSVKSEEGFKGDIVSLTDIFSAAFGAYFRRQVIARAICTVKEELAVLAVGAEIMEIPDIFATNDEPTEPLEPT